MGFEDGSSAMLFLEASLNKLLKVESDKSPSLGAAPYDVGSKDWRDLILVESVELANSSFKLAISVCS